MVARVLGPISKLFKNPWLHILLITSLLPCIVILGLLIAAHYYAVHWVVWMGIALIMALFVAAASVYWALRRTSQGFAAVADYITSVQNPSDYLTKPNNQSWVLMAPVFDVIAQLMERMRRTEYALLKNQEMAEQANQLKNDFLAAMSHEIRTPMNGILGTAEILGETALTTRQRGHVGTIVRSAECLLGIVNDILDFSKIESGRLELELIEFDLILLLEDVAELMAPSAYQRNLELVLCVPPNLNRNYIGDPFRIRQVLINLVNNALKFTPKGSIVLRVECLQQHQDEPVSLLQICVEDTGIGIPAEAQKNIFNKFSQADISTTRKYGGTGLGLSISQQLIDLMHGALYVASEVGVGSCFAINLQLEQSSAKKSAVKIDGCLRNRRIVILDDHPQSLQNIKRLLVAQGAQVTTRTDNNGLADLLMDALAAQPFDMIILDDELGDKQGIEVAAQIRQVLKDQAPAMVLLRPMGATAHSVQLIEKAGVVAVASKPARLQELNELIAAVIAGQAHGQIYTSADFKAHAPVTALDHQPVRRVVIVDLPDRLLTLLRAQVQLAGCEAIIIGENFEAPANAGAQIELIFVYAQAGAPALTQRLIQIRQLLEIHTASAIPVVALCSNADICRELKIAAQEINEFVDAGVDETLLAERIVRRLSHTNIAAVPKQFQGVSVLLVEDNLVNQAIVEEILLSMGLVVITALNGVQALEQFEKGGIQLVMMDCQMPIMDGYGCTAAIRTLELQRQWIPVPIIALTAHAISGEREKCLAAGMDFFLTKPISRRLLIDTLTQALEGKQSELYCLAGNKEEGAALELARLHNLFECLPNAAHLRYEQTFDDIFSLYLNVDNQLALGNYASVRTMVELIESIATLMGFEQIKHAAVDFNVRLLQDQNSAELVIDLTEQLYRLKTAIYKTHQAYEALIVQKDLPVPEPVAAVDTPVAPTPIPAAVPGFISFAQPVKAVNNVVASGNEVFESHADFLARVNSAPLVNEETFALCRQTLNSRFNEIVDSYFSDGAVYLEAIKCGIDDQSMGCIGQQAHPLKSASRTLGFMRMFLLAREVEQLSSEQNSAQDVLPAIEALSVSLRNTMQETFDYIYN